MSASDPLTDVLYQRMFRVFSYFADATTSGGLHPSQASFILDELNRESGRPSTSTGNAFSHDSVTFRELLNLVEVQFVDRSELEPLVERIFERIVGQVIRKGFVLFRCPGGGGSCTRLRRSNWRSGWCTVSPGVLCVWPLDKPINTDNRLTIPLDQEARVSSTKQTIHFAHFDPIACRAFVTDIRLAIERPTRSALQEFDQRRSLRHDGRRLDREVHERLQLETEKRRLEFELEQERLALKDEEIVRGLATSTTLKNIMRHLEWEDLGVKIDDSYLNHLRFADDMVLITPNMERVERMLPESDNACGKIGLQVNFTKTIFSRKADDTHATAEKRLHLNSLNAMFMANGLHLMTFERNKHL
ncbi:unnamed protein product [Haemonchus placei]|uniref:Reverse transcriptase domain-containing protein n=1 Tax=Haemonchus placei TaxID=6290 RepID=A0A158QK03_HAEPC|nr:unnamed protein product [Haemonchus placei]